MADSGLDSALELDHDKSEPAHRQSAPTSVASADTVEAAAAGVPAISESSDACNSDTAVVAAAGRVWDAGAQPIFDNLQLPAPERGVVDLPDPERPRPQKPRPGENQATTVRETQVSDSQGEPQL